MHKAYNEQKEHHKKYYIGQQCHKRTLDCGMGIYSIKYFFQPAPRILLGRHKYKEPLLYMEMTHGYRNQPQIQKQVHLLMYKKIKSYCIKDKNSLWEIESYDNQMKYLK